MSSLKLRSNAKVNLGLEIVGKRDDGYHLIRTLFLEVDFGDRLIFRKIDSPRCVLKSRSPSFPLKDSNLCSKAFHLLKDHFPNMGGVEIIAEKQIPSGGGLGGGSSNAATTLLALCRLYDLPAAYELLHSLGTRIGADVPFFLRGGLALGTGIGDVLESLDRKIEKPLVLVMPEIEIPTGWAFREVSYTLTDKHEKSKFKGFFDRRGQLRRFTNDFEPLIAERYPEIGDLLEAMDHLQADHASLSGSGAAVFGIFPDTHTAQEAAQALSGRYRTVVTRQMYRTEPKYRAFVSQ